MDARIERFAALLVDYCLAVKPEETIGVMGTTLAEPLLRTLYAALIERGAFPVLRATLPGLQKTFFDLAQDHQLDHTSSIELFETERLDGTIVIQSESNTRALTQVTPDKLARAQRARAPIREAILKKDRWCLTLYPTEAYAQDADMALADFEEFVFRAVGATQPDPVAAWRRLSAWQQGLRERLDRARDVRIVGQDTDLRFSIAGRTAVSSDGKRNMPSGEVFTGPVEDSAEGLIRFTYPACYNGREVEDVVLRFVGGRVVDARAGKGEAYLREMLAMDAGASALGEFGIGTNPRITTFTRTILFDEKILGTIHLALGRSYPETGGVNRSALHWDMIKDLRRGGAVYLDGEILQRDGEFVDLPPVPGADF